MGVEISYGVSAFVPTLHDDFPQDRAVDLDDPHGFMGLKWYRRERCDPSARDHKRAKPSLGRSDGFSRRDGSDEEKAVGVLSLRDLLGEAEGEGFLGCGGSGEVRSEEEDEFEGNGETVEGGCEGSADEGEEGEGEDRRRGAWATFSEAPPGPKERAAALRKALGSGYRVVSRQVAEGGTREYAVVDSASLAERAMAVDARRRTLNETVDEGLPCRLFLDLDVNLGDPPSPSPGEDVATATRKARAGWLSALRKVESALSDLCEYLATATAALFDLSETGGLARPLVRCAILDSSTSVKYSKHVVFSVLDDRYLFRDKEAAGYFVRHCAKRYLKEEAEVVRPRRTSPPAKSQRTFARTSPNPSGPFHSFLSRGVLPPPTRVADLPKDGGSEGASPLPLGKWDVYRAVGAASSPDPDSISRVRKILIDSIDYGVYSGSKEFRMAESTKMGRFSPMVLDKVLKFSVRRGEAGGGKFSASDLRRVCLSAEVLPYLVISHAACKHRINMKASLSGEARRPEAAIPSPRARPAFFDDEDDCGGDEEMEAGGGTEGLERPADATEEPKRPPAVRLNPLPVVSDAATPSESASGACGPKYRRLPDDDLVDFDEVLRWSAVIPFGCEGNGRPDGGRGDWKLLWFLDKRAEEEKAKGNLVARRQQVFEGLSRRLPSGGGSPAMRGGGLPFVAEGEGNLLGNNYADLLNSFKEDLERPSLSPPPAPEAEKGAAARISELKRVVLAKAIDAVLEELQCHGDDPVGRRLIADVATNVCCELNVPALRYKRESVFGDRHYLIFDAGERHKWCHTKSLWDPNGNGQHTSNNVFYVVDLNSARYYQKCYSPKCSQYAASVAASARMRVRGFGGEVGGGYGSEVEGGDDRSEPNLPSPSPFADDRFKYARGPAHSLWAPLRERIRTFLKCDQLLQELYECYECCEPAGEDAAPAVLPPEESGARDGSSR
jgi:hypothetical protein